MSQAASVLVGPDGLWVGTREGLIVHLSDDGGLWGMRVFASGLVQGLALSDDGALLLAGGDDGAVSVLRIADRTVIDAFRCEHPLVQGAVLALHVYVTVDRRRQGLTWALDKAGEMASTPICRDGVNPMPFDVFGVADGGARLTLLSALDWAIWDRAGNRVVADHQTIDGMQLAYMDGLVGLSADGGHCFMHWDDYLVFDASSGQALIEGSIDHRAACAALSNDGQRLAVGGREGSLAVIEAAGIGSVDLQPSDHAIAQLAWAPGGDKIAWLDAQGGIGVVDAMTGAELLDRTSGLERLQKALVLAWPP